MGDDLAAARDLARRVRFGGDTFRPKSIGDSFETRSLAGFLLHNELEITAQVTPDLAAQLDQVCGHLKIPRTQVQAFVYPASDLQAACYATSFSECVVRFSSALVDLLAPREFAFVCGHELGHFLLGHGISHGKPTSLSLEYFMAERAKEVSSDRIGLLACSSLEGAIRALMKTASGLTDEHLRFDVGTFVSQLTKSTDTANGQSVVATHPSMLVRCRALLWFSLSDCFSDPYGEFDQQGLDGLDDRISRDLAKYVDAPARRQIDEAKSTLAMWMAAYHIVEDGVFEKKEQAKFSEMFGIEMLQKMIAFLGDAPVSEVENIVYERVRSARRDLEELIPMSFEDELQTIEVRIRNTFA